MSASKFLKQFFIWDVIFGARSKKLAGINDGNNLISEVVTFSDVDNSITFPGETPSFFQENQYFRVFGGSNDSRLFRVQEVQFNKIITVENLINDSGTRTLDARLWVVHNNSKISRPTSTGSTMFNVHNRDTTGVDGDASAIALTYAEHYHDEDGIEDDKGVLISTQYNQLGCKSKVQADCCDEPFIELGPQLIFDDEGNALIEKIDDDTGVC